MTGRTDAIDPAAEHLRPSGSLLVNLGDELQRHAPFNEMDVAHVREFVAASRQAYFAPGETLVSPEAGPVRELFFIRRGAVTGKRGLSDVSGGAFQYEAGDLFPISAVLAQRAPTTSYSATEDTFVLAIPVQAMQALIHKAKTLGIVACDPGSAGYIADHSVHTFLAAIAGTDLLLPSLEEGRILSAESRPEIVSALLGEWFPQVALTLGEDGVQLQSQTVAELIPAIAADLVDATGAGDAFAASLLAETLKGKDFSQAAHNAVRFAAKAVTKLGGRP